MRRVIGLGLVAAIALLGVLAAPVAAKSRIDVRMAVETVFGEDPNDFTATIPGCEEGDTYSEGGAVFPPVFGVFVGYKAFDCYGGGETGFLVRLSAQFSYSGAGSSGTWTIVDSWGDLAGMSGGGKLVGVPMDGVDGITDYYEGRVTL